MPRDLLAGQPRDLLAEPQPGSLESLRGSQVQQDLAEAKSLNADKAIGAGLVNFLTGTVGTIGDVKSLIDLGLDKLGLPQKQGKTSGGRFGGAPTTPQTRQALTESVGPVYEPQLGLETGLAKGGELLPQIMFGPGGALRRGVENVAMPYLGGEIGKKLTEGTGYEALGEIGGELLGGVTTPSVERVIRPSPIPPERQALIDALTREGVPLTAGQRTGSRRVEYLETELGGEAYARRRAEQGEAATRAALRRIGEDAPRATTNIMARANRRIGGEFDRLAASTSVPLDQQLQNDLLNRVTRYQAVTGTPAPGAEFMMNRIAELAAQNGGRLEGAAYKNIRSEMGELIANSDAPTKQVFRQMQEALDDAIERHMSPMHMEAWRTARNQYKNFLVIEDVMSTGGPDVAQGIIPPERLRSPSVVQNQRAYVTGRGDFADLAHAGEGLLRQPPQSGTAARTAARALPAAAATGLGTGAGALLSGGDLTLTGLAGTAGAAAGLAAPAIYGRAAMTQPIQNWLASGQQGTWSEAARRQLLIQALTAPRLFAPQKE